MLPFAIESVLAQERRDFELFVICDGAPPQTAEVARRYAAGDTRIRVFEHPKGERHGEAYRHQAVQHASGVYVCQLGDDDLWLPNHLGEMARLLEQFDFGNLSHVEVAPDGKLVLLPGDLADPATRLMMQSRPFNFFGPTASGYRLEAYRALPIGWSPAPTDLATDLFMWRKFLARDDLRFGTLLAVTSIKFTAGIRSGWSLEQRRDEIASWAQRLSRPGERAMVQQMALLSLSRSALNMRERIRSLQLERRDLRRLARKSDKLSRKLESMRRSWSWRLTFPFRMLAYMLTGRGPP